MGGIPVNTDGQVRRSADNVIEGLFAAGECACVSVHGANRLGSNSLLECVVYGRRTGAAIAQYLQGRKWSDFDAQTYLDTAKNRVQSLLNQEGTLRLNQLRLAFQDCMSEHCGVFRSEETMQEGLKKLHQLRQQYEQIRLDDKDTCFNTELIEALELGNLMLVSEIILASALSRQESRGAHSREDYPQRDDANFLKHTLAYYSPAGIDTESMSVVINRFEPKERKY